MSSRGNVILMIKTPVTETTIMVISHPKLHILALSEDIDGEINNSNNPGIVVPMSNAKNSASLFARDDSVGSCPLPIVTAAHLTCSRVTERVAARERPASSDMARRKKMK